MSPCCLDPANRVRQEDPRPDLTLEVCQVCGRRHFVLTLDPTALGLTVVS